MDFKFNMQHCFHLSWYTVQDMNKTQIQSHRNDIKSKQTETVEILHLNC